MALTNAYRTGGPEPRESVEALRARIPGWGADLDPADRPQVPRESLEWRPEGATWDLPEQQPHDGRRERSIEHADLTPVFGTAQPLHGVSGRIRRLAYDRYSEARLAHWLLLIVGDRVDVAGGVARSLATTRPINPLVGSGVRAELTRHGWSSRVGRSRSDVVHHPMDPFVVAGPWLLAGWAAYSAGRRLRRVLRR